MKLDVLYFLVLGYFIEASDGGGGHKHVKIIVPAVIHKHTHKHTVYKKVPVHHGDKKHIVIHNHHHNHKHGHGHKHGHDHKHKHAHKHDHKHKAQHGHKHDHKHKHGHKHKHKHLHSPKKNHYDHSWHGWKQHNSDYQEPKITNNYDYDINPVEFDDDGYLTSKKSVRSEHYEVKSLNPHALYPEDKYIVKGSYKVEETDPYDFKTTSFETYDSPITKKIAKAIISFGGKYDNIFQHGNEGEEQEGDKRESKQKKAKEADHEYIENYEDNDEESSPFKYENYEDDGDNTKTVQEYQIRPDYEESKDDNYNYGHDDIERYISKKIYGH